MPDSKLGNGHGALYFAYGSNMSPAQMAERCPGATLVSTATLPGYRLAFTRFSPRWQGYVADILPDPAGTVHGVLWRVTAAHLAALDRFEGVASHAYRRHPVQPLTPDGLRHEAVTYVVVDPAPEGQPSGAYLDVITAAARLHNLPTPWLAP